MYKNLENVFKYPSPDAKASPSPSRGEGSGLLRCARNDGASNSEGLHRPWCDKILGTRPRMTGGRVANFFGRSMIEMLGVLAIIAVLSVGGIAGYSKAMEMWKISKQKQQIAEIFMQTINLKEDFMREYNRTQTYVRTVYIMNTMDIIPDGMTLVDDYNIQDSAGNNVRIYFNSWNHKAAGLEYMLMFDIFNSDKSKRQMQSYCAVFLEQAQAISPYILNVTKRNYEIENGSVSGYTVDNFNFYSATPSDIYNFCKSCSSEFSCSLLLKFKL